MSTKAAKKSSATRARGRMVATEGSGLEAGRFSRRMSGWIPARDHINTLVSSSGRTALARARYLVRNNPYAAAAVQCFADNLVGTGIVPSWNLKDQTLKAALQKAWMTWTDESDAESVTDLYGQMRRGARELFIAGEFFIRLRPRYLTDGLSVPLQLQMLPSEQLPVEMTMTLANGNVIRQGIEFDKIGRRVAYHFWIVNPGDFTEAPKQGQITRVPADQVLHVFDPVEAGQIRGLSRLTPAIVLLWSLDGYDDAELERKKTAALFTGFVKRSDPEGEFFDKAKEDAAKAGNGIADVTLEAGRMHVLFPGEDITTAAPADVGPAYEMFQYRQLTRFAAAVGLPYAGITGDVMRANYSNQRAAMVSMRRAMEATQHSVMVFLFCRPVINKFLDAAALAGTVEMPEYAAKPEIYRDVTHIPPRWEWVDPLKDRQAEVLAVNAGFKARSQVIEAEGGDAIETDNRIAEDQKRAERLGLVFNAVTLSKTGASQTPTDGAGNPHGDIMPQDENNPPNDPTSDPAAAPASKVNLK